MKKFYYPALAALLAGTVSMEAAPLRSTDANINPYRYARTVKAPGFNSDADRAVAAARLQAAAADKQITTEAVSFLEGPDGSIWYAVSQFDREFVQVSEYYKESIIKAYTFTVYDNNFNEVGTIHDEVVVEDGETKPASIAIDATVTQKFFNSDSNYEVIVAIVMNKADLSEMPYVNIRSKVYSLGGAKADGNDVSIATIPGYSVAAVNAAQDAWSENFYISFYQETAGKTSDFESFDEYLASYKAKVVTYKKAGYSTPFSELFTIEVPQIQLPGDQSSSPFFFSCIKNGKATFVVSQYSKPLYVSPSDPTNDGLTPDNTLNITVKQLAGSYNPTLEDVATVDIPCVQSAGNALYTFYGIGNLMYTGDVDFEHYSADGKPHYIVSVDDYTPSSDSYVSSYYVYNAEGERTLTLAEGTENFVMMSDVAGQQPQAMFIHNAEGAYTFDYVELYTGTTACSTGATIGNYGLTAAIDRVADPAYGYLYACSLAFTSADADGNYIERIGWFNTDAEMVRVDEVNLGKNLSLAQAYIAGHALTPFVFNTDEAVEYMFLVKRHNQTGGGAIEEQLVVCAPGAEPILTVGPDPVKGVITNVNLIDGDTKQLCVIFTNTDENGVQHYTQDIYSLPFNRFAGGDGTAENPYLIATAGDFAQIKAAPQASFRLANDIDLTGIEIKPMAEFSGTLDGDGKKIKGLTINGATGSTGIFAFAEFGSVIKDLTIVDATLTLASSTGSAGIVAGTARNATFTNVSVLGVKATGDEYDDNFGTIAGRCTNGTVIAGCYVAGADINLPSTTAGGIAGNLLTGSSVKASAFMGTLIGGSNVGGIVGDIVADATVTDCHADAAITAAHTVGGIVGTTARGKISRCHAEGTIAAIEPSRWGGPAAGGIVGNIEQPTEENNGIVVENCLVTVSAITTEGGEDFEEEFPGQLATLHRIAGRTAINMEPEVLDYDEEWNPIYGDPIAETGFASNYVSSGLARGQETIDAASTTTEGADIDRYEVGYDFLTGLGYSFGTDATAPWAIASGFDPALYFETMVILDNAEIAAAVNETFTINLTILAREIPEEIFGDFMAEFDENKINMTGNYTLEGNKLAVEMQALAEGIHPFSISLLGSTVAGTVNVATSGISDAVTDAATITIAFDGTTVSADGAISVFNLAGTLVATGNGTVSAAELPSGIYIVRAVAADGTAAVRKIAK